MRGRIEKGILILIMGLCLFYTTALAAASPQILEVSTDEERIVAYVGGVGEVSEAAASVGKTECTNVSLTRMSEGNYPLRTLILIDNSISIPTAGRTKCKQFLEDMIAARAENEYFAVGTISEGVEQKTDFSNDYTMLRDALEGLEYNDQETYLTDALYDYLAEDPFAGDIASFTRILILSDGVDNKSIGYTRDELLGLLKKAPVPVYTVGIYNSKKSNQSELEQMFAISRATGADYRLLDEIENSGEFADLLTADRENVVVTVRIPEKAKDGSTQTLTLTFDNGSMSVSADGIRMPLAIDQSIEETSSAAETETEEETSASSIEEEEQIPLWILIAGVAVAVVLIVIILVVILIGRHKKEKKQEQKFISNELDNTKTQILEDDDPDGGNTIGIWGSEISCAWRVILTDLKSPTRSYEKSINKKSLVIGRDPSCDIVIDHDKSVSHKQCELRKEGDQLYLLNYSKSNVTVLNGEEVSRKTLVTRGSILKMGRVEMRIDFEEEG